MLPHLRVVSLGTLLSRVLGLARDVGMATLFGAGTVLDAFIVAFRLPNLSRQLFGEGALSTAFLPIFIRDREERGDLAARQTLTAVAVVLALLLSGFVLVAELSTLLALWLVDLSDASRLLLQLLAILLPYLVLICVSALLSAALHAQRKFLVPALVPVVLNVMWLSGLGIAWKGFGFSRDGIYLVALSITLAGVVQMLLPAVVLARAGIGLTRTWRAGWPRVREVFRVMLPVVGGISLMQLNTLVDALMAWGLARPDAGGPALGEAFGIPPLLESGTATALYLGQRMYQFPLGIFGIALGTVLYPVLVQHAQRGELERLRDDLTYGIRLVLGIGLPASAGLVLLAQPLTMVLFRHGQFDAEAARFTARMIAIYGAGVWAYIGLGILNRAFYAAGDRLTPMRLGLGTLILNLSLNVVLVWFLGGIGLALGSVTAAVVQLTATGRLLNRRIGSLNGAAIRQTAAQAILATMVMSAACLVLLESLPDWESLTGRLAILCLPMLTGMAVYLSTFRMLFGRPWQRDRTG